MRYLLAIYDDETKMANASEEAMSADLAAWFQYTEELEKSGKMLAGEALQPTQTATTVRFNGSSPAAPVDGPFAETKEQLGGYYLIDATDLDDAIVWASKVPLHGGSVEIRPIMEFDAP